MTFVKSLAIGSSAFALGVLAFFAAMALTWTVAALTFDWSDDMSHGTRVSLAVVTLVLWWSAFAAAALVSTRKVSVWVGVEYLGPLFVVTVMAGAVLYWSLEIASETNACLWDVGFPLDRECWSK